MSLFQTKSVKIMRQLMQDLPWNKEDSAACLGNLGAETGGFTQLQEIRPTVPGSRGGFGWAQWTGPRRRQYEAYCKENNLEPKSDEANYGFLLKELKTTYSSTVQAVHKAKTLEDKVKAFEETYEKAGVKNYKSRINYARQALVAYNAQPERTAVQTVAVGTVASVLAWLSSPAGHGAEILLGTIFLASLIGFAIHFYRQRKLNVSNS